MYNSGPYQIDIFRETTFTQDSVDNRHQYGHVYFVQRENSHATVIGVKIFKDDILLTSAVIGGVGGATVVADSTIIVEQKKVLMCCCDSIVCLSIPELQLLWKTRADFGTCFEMFKFQDDYIVHGEQEISRLDKDGKIMWSQTGADIFMTEDGIDDFQLTDKLIIAKDWESRIYKFDYEGNDHTDMSQFPPKKPKW